MARITLWDDLHMSAGIDTLGAAHSSLRVRDLVSTGQVTQHSLSSPVREEPQESGACNCTNVALEGVHVYLCPAWERDIDGAGIDRREAYDLPDGGSWHKDRYGVPYWSPNGAPGTWSIDESGLPVFTEVLIAEFGASCIPAQERRWARLLDLAWERGDKAAIAILEGPVFGYADRFMAGE